VPKVAVNDIELYYESAGTGFPLLMLGGLGLCVGDMRRLTEGLASDRQVIAVDNRGTGESSKPPGPYSIQQMAGDAIALLDALAIERADVLGISMGGRIALSMALDHPDRVRRLVLVSTGPRAAGKRWLVRIGMRLQGLTGLLGQQTSPHHALQAQYDATTRYNCTDRLGKITAPTLIVHGKIDHIAPLAVAEEMSRAIPDATMVTFNGGHLVSLMTHAGQVVDAVRDFLEDTSADGT
jgi:pimeloyl-ACP methyl ester carboxylesterase